ncbi:tRNA (adenosine(37)-N6)-threonylcarbamoyltransferase complex dimerization subunit type 1 TsaB [Candidatus Epulonipiscium fishelsonii]|uniref:tRNA (Adenosine(37)-N6)-threonylcarbamoyltransferase complex dimerization subunit type 1 TsaB n=1 Tax=Candidatus Epulonipiscium fishelsonii TaxID=77094 RepID=A0ACC8X8Z5_9FIRM|nr:tRNA (adenosine(37)-N6)-threonylcarbamoyltransferase complex dimerization subunit type 1 TsaB [Epulopiscium sp. SCG-B11WGA-EpuloA1]ONI39931.1 tRNA (adenosine(37)-N6)-threonylcarbamoyltransferase complex dimerization subunit type 1 TsaB [Epulopiscium sp. SCG-B05WGA-EpuloA1]
MIIAIDASGLAGSVSAIKEGNLLGEYYICNELTHAQTIMPMLEDLKRILNLNLGEVKAIAVTSGPGSFTGLRIGVTTAKALALSLEVPIIGVPTLDVLANGVPFTDYLICPIMDARRNQVYTALYKWNETELEQLVEYQAIDIDIIIGIIEQFDMNVIFVGDGVDVYKSHIKNILKDSAKFMPSFLKMQHSSVLAYLANKLYKEGQVEDADSFTPLYIRKSQAERELEERENNIR